MKLRKEFIIGLVVIFISVAMFYGIRFIQGSNLFLDSIKVHASYPQINNLQVGNPIYINGLKVGLVTATKISHDKDAHIEVDLTLETKYPIPKNSTAEIMELGVMGGMGIDLLLGDAQENLEDGDIINASIRMGMIDEIIDNASPIASKTERLFNKLESTIDEYSNFAKSLNGKLEEIELKSTIHNINEMVVSFKNASEKAQTTMDKFTVVGDSLNKIEFQKVVANFDELLVSTKGLIEKIKTEDE